jgi:hypothetical protein
VVIVNQQPVLTPELAVVLQNGHPVLIPVNSQGSVTDGTSSPSGSLDGQLTVELSEVTSLPRIASGGGAISTNGTSFGSFQLVTSLGSGGSGGLSSAQMSEPGLYRESTVNMGGFKVIYHEPLAEARQQAESNTAQGSSYREFLDSENPRFDIVRATPRQEPGDESANPGAGRKPQGTL